MTNPSHYTANLTQIRGRFVDKLARWLPEFEILLADLKGQRPLQSDLKELRMRAHKLAGSAKTFGFDELTPAAIDIENALELLQGHTPVQQVAPKLISALEAFLEDAHRITTDFSLGASIPPQEEHVVHTPMSEAKYRILVVDDDELVRSLLTEMLSPEGCHVVQAVNGADALARLAHTKETADHAWFDLVVLDLNMPGMNGMEVLQHMKDQPLWREIPVLLLTRHDESETVMRGISLGAVDYITKPFDVAELGKKILGTLKGRGTKILISDDDELLCSLLRHRFNLAGYSVLETHTGDEALSKIRNEPPDVVILDLMMPGMDGMSVLRHMRKDAATAHIPVVILSAKRQQENIVEGLENGAYDYITKPFDVDELAVRVAGILQRRAVE